MDKSFLLTLFGFPATLIHGDTLVLDRWLWLRRRLPRTANGETLIDIGCGTGAFSIGAALRGYKALGLSWDQRNQAEAAKRAAICKTEASFEVQDVRCLNSHENYYSAFDVAICLENVEHILNDRKLIIDIYNCLKPGGRLLLTAPNFYYNSISKGDDGPFLQVETGWHVRRGYTSTMLQELCREAGLIIEEISYCSGFFSQKTTALMRWIGKLSWKLAWIVTLPLRPFALIMDLVSADILKYPMFSICLVAEKPRVWL